MKIAFVLESFPSISETFILNQITGLIDKGHTVDIFASYKNINQEKVHEDIVSYNLLEKCNFIDFPKNKFFRILKSFLLILFNFKKNYFSILKSLNFFEYGKKSITLHLLYFSLYFSKIEKEYDIIHCHFGNNGILGSFLKEINETDAKIITTFHGSDITQNYNIKDDKYNLVFKNSSICTVNSNFLMDKVVNLGCKSEKLIKLPVGVDLDFFSPENNKKIKKEKIKILTVSRLVPYKGLKYSIKAVSKIVKNFPDKKIIYQIIGDGYEREFLLNLITELNMNKYIKLEGNKKRSEVKEYYNKADIFILPSISFKDGREEGQGLVIQEAQAMCLPVIVTDVGGIPEGIINNETGFLIEDKNIKEIESKVKLLITDYGRRIEMGLKGREFVKDKFNQKVLNDKLERIYYNLIG